MTAALRAAAFAAVSLFCGLSLAACGSAQKNTARSSPSPSSSSPAPSSSARQAARDRGPVCQGTAPDGGIELLRGGDSFLRRAVPSSTRTAPRTARRAALSSPSAAP